MATPDHVRCQNRVRSSLLRQCNVQWASYGSNHTVGAQLVAIMNGAMSTWLAMTDDEGKTSPSF